MPSGAALRILEMEQKATSFSAACQSRGNTAPQTHENGKVKNSVSPVSPVSLVSSGSATLRRMITAGRRQNCKLSHLQSWPRLALPPAWYEGLPPLAVPQCVTGLIFSDFRFDLKAIIRQPGQKQIASKCIERRRSNGWDVSLPVHFYEKFCCGSADMVSEEAQVRSWPRGRVLRRTIEGLSDSLR